MAARALEKPLPKPRRDLAGYASACTLEALLESILALEFLDKGYTRNAAGKAFQAWRALLGALLALERDKLLKRLEGEEERRWLEETGIPRIPTSRLKTLSRLLEDVGYTNLGPYTDRALDLHDYQYHGPDPSGELSKYPDEGEARHDIVYLLAVIAEIIKEKVKPALEKAGAWTDEHEQALSRLAKTLRAQRNGSAAQSKRYS